VIGSNCPASAVSGELAVNYGKLVTISVDPPRYRQPLCGSGAQWPFCPMKTGADQANQYSGRNRRRVCLSRPALFFVLRPDLTIYKIYNGWFFVGRPQLRNCGKTRAIMETRSDYRYEAYDMPEVRRIGFLNRSGRTVRPLGASGLPVARRGALVRCPCRQRANCQR